MNTYMLFTGLGRSVLGETVPEVSSTAQGRRPRAVVETEGTVFPNTDQPRLVNNIFIYFLILVLDGRGNYYEKLEKSCFYFTHCPINVSTNVQ